MSRRKRSARQRAAEAGKPKTPVKPRLADWLIQGALLIIITVTVTRLFLPETHHRANLIPVAEARQARQAAHNTLVPEALPQADRNDLARATLATLLLLAAAMGVIGLAMRDQWKPAWSIILGAGFAFAALAWVSKLTGLAGATTSSLAWADAVAPLLAGGVMIGICSNRRRFALLAGVLAAAGVVLALQGLWQYGVEAPQRIAEFRSDPAKYLARLGMEPGSVEAEQLETRLAERTPTGTFGLANAFASALLVLGALVGGLAIDRWRAARRTREAFRRRAPKGEVHPATLLAGLTGLALIGILAVIGLTRSLGAIGAALAGAITLGLCWPFRARLGRHWKTGVVAAGLAFLLVAAAVVGYGLANDRLPTRTMTFRWHYWTGGAEALSRRPILGAGPGGFAQAYLAARRPAAEEAVKTPHNVIVHSLVQYGIVAGGLHLALLGGTLVLLSRPRRRPRWSLSDPAAGSRRAKVVTGLTVVVALVLLRGWLVPHQPFSTDSVRGFPFLANTLIPALLLGGTCVLSLWRVDRCRLAAVRIALAVGLAAFVLHNMVTFTLTMPATTTLFWICAGGVIGFARRGSWGPGAQADLTRRWRLTSRDAAVATALLCVLIPLGLTLVSIWVPALTKTQLIDDALQRYVRGQKAASGDLLDQALEAVDGRDALLRYDGARLLASWASRPYDQAGRETLAEAFAFAGRTDLPPRNHRLAGELAFDVGSWDYYLMRWPRSAGGAAMRLENLRKTLDPAKPPSPGVLSMLAAGHYQLGQYGMARATLGRLLAIRPGCVTARLRRGDAAWLDGDLSNARADWREAHAAIRSESGHGGNVVSAPPNAVLPAWMDRGLGRMAGAAKLDPWAASLRIDLARRLARRGRYRLALDDLEMARKRHDALEPRSLHRFDDYTLSQLRVLRARCLAMLEPATSEETSP
jgi:tetratricopeptide (TPR) repeat protein